jgi:hypothetical protein
MKPPSEVGLARQKHASALTKHNHRNKLGMLFYFREILAFRTLMSRGWQYARRHALGKLANCLYCIQEKLRYKQ